MMNRVKGLLCVLIILILGIQSVSGAISVRDISITPGGNLISGQSPPEQVTVSYVVDFLPEGGVTFSSHNSLHMNTDLENPLWSYSTELDGFPSPESSKTGKKLDISGWELSYPSKRTVSLAVNLTGTVPVVATTGKKTLIHVSEMSNNGVIPGSEVTREANVVLPGSAPLHSSPGTVTEAPSTPQPTVAPVATVNAPPKDTLNLPSLIVSVIVLLISFIPLGLLVFHDHFGLGKREIPAKVQERTVFALIYILCGFGLFYVMGTIQRAYTEVAPGPDMGVATVFLLALFFLSYLILSSLVLAIGSIISRGFCWTLKVHQVAGILTLILVAVTILLPVHGQSPGTGIILIAAIASIVSAGCAFWQGRLLRDDLGAEDWFSHLVQAFAHARKKRSPLTGKETEALSVLDMRLAQGEISLEEYQKMKEAIRK